MDDQKTPPRNFSNCFCRNSDYYLSKSYKMSERGKKTHKLLHNSDDFYDKEYSPDSCCGRVCSACNRHKKSKFIDLLHSSLHEKCIFRPLRSWWTTSSSSKLSSSSLFWRIFLSLLFIIVCLSQPSHCGHSSNSFSSRYPPTYDVWDYETALDPDGAFVVEWSPLADKVFFRVTVKTKGYIGFGLSSSGRMAGADIVVG